VEGKREGKIQTEGRSPQEEGAQVSKLKLIHTLICYVCGSPWLTAVEWREEPAVEVDGLVLGSTVTPAKTVVEVVCQSCGAEIAVSMRKDT
jgi:hypothetical protein